MAGLNEQKGNYHSRWRTICQVVGINDKCIHGCALTATQLGTMLLQNAVALKHDLRSPILWRIPDMLPQATRDKYEQEELLQVASLVSRA